MARGKTWVVYNPRSDFRAEFDSKDRAVGNARTNAESQPGVKFIVAQVIGHAKVEQPTIWTDYE